MRSNARVKLSRKAMTDAVWVASVATVSHASKVPSPARRARTTNRNRLMGRQDKP